MTDHKPFNQESDPLWNREPGIVPVPGSNFMKEVAKFEQFPSKFTLGTQPGNPYTFRPFPKMLYRAQRFNGSVVCMAAPPDPVNFADPRAYERAAEQAAKFTESCQRIVKDEVEMSRAFEAGWRESAAEAVEFVHARDRAVGQATAERNYEDRNMSAGAKREIAEAIKEAGGEHLPMLEEKPRRGRPRKVVA